MAKRKPIISSRDSESLPDVVWREATTDEVLDDIRRALDRLPDNSPPGPAGHWFRQQLKKIGLKL